MKQRLTTNKPPKFFQNKNNEKKKKIKNIYTMASETNLTKIKTTSLVFLTYIMASAFVLTVSYMFSLK